MSQEHRDAIGQMMRHAPVSSGQVHARRWAILAVLCLSVFLALIALACFRLEIVRHDAYRCLPQQMR